MFYKIKNKKGGATKSARLHNGVSGTCRGGVPWR